MSSLSNPIRGRNTGSVQTALVHSRERIVWDATCPRLSPVIRAPQAVRRAIFSAIRIINRRMMMVSSSCGHLS